MLFKSSEKGQSLTEYALILVVVAVIVIVVLLCFWGAVALIAYFGINAAVGS